MIPGESSIRSNFTRFEALVDIAESFGRAADYRSAAACAQVAAACAWRNHAGLFASPRLERLLTEIGSKAVSAEPVALVRGRRTPPRRVLHVLTKARPMGGDSRFSCRWMHVDAERQHSVAVTTQERDPVPEVFLTATSRTGGHVHCLDADTTDPMVRAGRLRSLAQHADVVALHIYPDDVIPSLAFADGAVSAPVLFLNHSDHTFWLGVNASNMVVQLRDSSVPLSVHRRGIDPERLATLPIPLPPVERTRWRAEAKYNSDWRRIRSSCSRSAQGSSTRPSPDRDSSRRSCRCCSSSTTRCCSSSARSRKGSGPGRRRRPGGACRALGRRLDTPLLFEAADVYLDSFPFTSPTALLEAGSYGLPLVAYLSPQGRCGSAVPWCAGPRRLHLPEPRPRGVCVYRLPPRRRSGVPPRAGRQGATGDRFASSGHAVEGAAG